MFTWIATACEEVHIKSFKGLNVVKILRIVVGVLFEVDRLSFYVSFVMVRCSGKCNNKSVMSFRKQVIKV